MPIAHRKRLLSNCLLERLKSPKPSAVATLPIAFATQIIKWQRKHGRHDLPWQNTSDAYRIWLSEVMLQQTQVATVIGYYARFLLRFPTVDALAHAPSDDVMALWAGLGYYSRARNLHHCAKIVVEKYASVFPSEPQLLQALPGIGRSTAAAIAAFAYGAPAAILDGNVKRVFCRVFGVEGYPGLSKVSEQLWAIAEREMATTGIEAYTQGLMDLGASLCSRRAPRCEQCPLAPRCVAFIGHRQAELPHRKAKIAARTKKYVFLWIEDKGKVLLVRRPPSGIWGGLWCLPEEPESAPRGVSNSAALAGFEHTFTHFKMLASVYRMSSSVAANDSPTLWVDLGNLDDIGLPAPIKSCLSNYFSVSS